LKSESGGEFLQTAEAARLHTLSATASSIWVAVAGVVAYMFLPLIVGGLAEEFGFTPAELGFIGAAEAGGMGIANAIAVFLVRKINWRSAIFVSSSVMVAANFCSMQVSGFAELLGLRLVDGFAGGILIAVGIACQSDNRNSGRVFGYFVACEMLLASIGFLVLPRLQLQFGVDAIFLVMMIVAASGAGVAVLHPKSGLDVRHPNISSNTKGVGFNVWITSMAGALLFFTSQGGLWAFVERIGVSSGVASDVLAFALSISSLFGIVGALGASWLVFRVGLFRSFLVVLIGELVAMCLLFANVSGPEYIVSVSLFIFSWSLALPLMLMQLNRIDGTGKLVVMLYAVGKFGYAIGPALMGQLVLGGGYLYLIAVSVLLCVFGVVISLGLALSDSAGEKQQGVAV